LLRNHTRSAIIVHRRGQTSTLVTMSWQALEDERKRAAEKVMSHEAGLA